MKRELKDAILKALRSIFNNPPGSIAKVLAWTANTYLLTKVLNLDPDCRNLEREMFSKCRLFLDTNVILACVLSSQPKHAEVAQLLSICHNLNVDLRYTKTTHEELMRVIERSNELHEKGLAAKTPSIGYYEHDVIRTYLEDYKIGGMTWNQYYLMLSKSANKLKNQFAITLDDTDYTNVVSPEEVEAFAPIVRQCSGARHIKSQDVASHDAFHILLTEKLREAELQPRRIPHTTDREAP